MARWTQITVGIALGVYVLALLPFSIFGVWNLPMEYTYFNTPGAPNGATPKSNRFGFEWWLVLVLVVFSYMAPLIGIFYWSESTQKWELQALLVAFALITVIHLTGFISLSVIWGNNGADSKFRGIAQDRLYCCAKYVEPANDCPNTSPCTGAGATDVNGDPLLPADLPTDPMGSDLSTTREFRTLYFFTLGFLVLDVSWLSLTFIDQGYAPLSATGRSKVQYKRLV